MESGGEWVGWSVSGVEGREREVLDVESTVLVLTFTARAHSLRGTYVYHFREKPRCEGGLRLCGVFVLPAEGAPRQQATR